MATIDLRDLPRDHMVIHFGGRPREVNAFTFANSLISLSEALRAINRQINPDHSIEIVVDAVGPGSFRTRIRERGTLVSKLIHRGLTRVALPLLVAFIYDRYMADDDINIIVNDDSYVIERGSDRIILPKDVYDAQRQIKQTAEINNHVSRTFEALDSDESI